MRILFVGLSLPYPPTTGHRLRTWALLQSLARDGHDITLLSFAEPGEHVDHGSPLRKLCRRVDVVPVPGGDGSGGEYGRRLRALLSPLPYGAWRFRSPVLQALIQAELDGGRVEMIVCDGVYNMVNVPDSAGVAVALNKDDVAHLIMTRYLRFERSPAKRLYGWIEARKVRAWERRGCRHAAVTLACSEYDRGILQALWPGASVAVVPNVVDTDHYAPAG